MALAAPEARQRGAVAARSWASITPILLVSAIIRASASQARHARHKRMNVRGARVGCPGTHILGMLNLSQPLGFLADPLAFGLRTPVQHLCVPHQSPRAALRFFYCA
jgi:hypothetical protein